MKKVFDIVFNKVTQMKKSIIVALSILVIGIFVFYQTFLYWDNFDWYIRSAIVIAYVYAIGYGIHLNRDTLYGWLPKKKVKTLKLVRSDRTKRKGLYIDVYSWNLLYRPAISLLVGAIIPSIIWVADHYYGTNVINFYLFLGATVFFASFAGNREFDKPIKIRKTTYAILTLWGNRLRIYLKEGDYFWSLFWLGLTISRETDLNSVGIDKDGNISAFDIPLQIWNDSDLPENGKPVLDLVANASNTATVHANLTVNIKFYDAKSWMDSENPTLLTAEAFRHAFRTAVGFFIDTDAHVLESAYQNLLLGHTLLTVYRPDGSVIRNRAGHPIYKAVPHGATEDELESHINSYLQELKEKVKPNELDECSVEGQPEIHFKSVYGIHFPILDRLGVDLVSVAVSEARPSNEVIKQANIASGEDYQLKGQVKSAKAFKEASNIRNEAAEGVSELIQVITAAEDNPEAFNVVYTVGSEMTKAAATHASVSNRKGGES